MRKQEPSSKQKRSSSYLSDTLLLIQTHTLSCSSSSAHSTLHLTLPFLKVCHPFLGIPLHYFLGLSHHLPLIPLISCIVSLSPSTCHLCILVLFFSKAPLTQKDAHTCLLFPRRLLFPSLKDVWYPSRKAVGIRAL